MRDAPKLKKTGDILNEIAGTMQRFSEVAGKSGQEGGHAELDQINKSLSSISTAVKGLNTRGDHSAAYRSIEKNLADIGSAVEKLAAGASPR